MRVIEKKDVIRQLHDHVNTALLDGVEIDCVEITYDEKRQLVSALHNLGETFAANTLQTQHYAMVRVFGQEVKVVVR